MERVSAAGAQVERAKAPAAIGRDVAGLDVRAAAAIKIVARADVAGRDAGATVRADARVDAGDEAREVAPYARGIAVAVEAAPGAKTLRPEHDVGGRRRRHQRRLHDRGLGVGKRGKLLAVREGQRPAERERRHAGVAAIGSLAQPAEHRGAHIAALVHQHARGRGVHFA